MASDARWTREDVFELLTRLYNQGDDDVNSALDSWEESHGIAAVPVDYGMALSAALDGVAALTSSVTQPSMQRTLMIGAVAQLAVACEVRMLRETVGDMFGELLGDDTGLDKIAKLLRGGGAGATAGDSLERIAGMS